MKIQTNNIKIPVSLKLLQEDKKAYIKLDVHNDGNTEILLQDIPEIFFDHCHNDIYDKYTLFVLKRDNLKENQIANICLKKTPEEKEKRIGFIIPTMAIESQEHDFAENTCFWKFSNAALQILFNTNNNFIFSNTIDINQEKIYLSDLLGGNIAFLVIEKKGFDISEIFSSIISYGFLLREENEENEENEEKNNLPKNLHLLKISPDLENVKFQIFNILKIYHLQSNSAFRFFLLYQIIEILMQEIFQNTKNELLESLENQTNVNKIRKILQNYTSEENRLGKLVDTYAVGNGTFQNIEDLQNACKNYLYAIGLISSCDENIGSFHNYIYEIRNALFHNFRLHNESNNSKLDNVVNELLKIIPKILFSYKRTTSRP